MDVVIVDDRKPWMIEEDRLMTCAWFCPLYRNCTSRFGRDCKRFGGPEIPKIRIIEEKVHS